MVLRWLLLSFLLALVPCIAQARPRDAVMAGAYRCSAIGAPRHWLDCYYGAAQPVRAQLGMPPAPEEQVRLNLAPPASPVTPQIAALRDGILASALHCYAIAEDRAWLDCYYAAAQPMRAELGLVPGPQAVLDKPKPAVIPAGAPLPSGEQMASYSFDRNRVFTVTLANGQIWRQLSGDTHTAHWRKPAGAYVVHVTHGLFGSFNLQVEGLPQVYKVDRVG